jgi:hypothetical protein
LQTRNGQLLVAGTLVVGLLLPLVLHLPLLSRPWHTVVAPVLVLLGGFILRYAILTTPAELLARAPESQAQSAGEAGYDFGTPGPVVLPELRPEDRRPVGGGPGADPGNKSGEIKPRSKLFNDRSP